MKTLYRLLGIIGVFFMVQSCQYNDICTAETPGTPKLLIQFYNADRPGLLKEVEGFNAKAIGDTAYYFESPVTDTIVALPLNTNASKTSYEFVIYQDDSTKIKRDTISFTYKTEDVFISRACGFKDIFTDFEVEWELSNTGWIKNRRIIDTTKRITNERKAPLYIYY